MDLYKGVVFPYPLNLERYNQTLNDMAEAGYTLQRITPLTDMPHTNGVLVTFRMAAVPTLAVPGAQQQRRRQSPIEQSTQEKE